LSGRVEPWWPPAAGRRVCGAVDSTGGDGPQWWPAGQQHRQRLNRWDGELPRWDEGAGVLLQKCVE
jgi:hypothetical protein